MLKLDGDSVETGALATGGWFACVSKRLRGEYSIDSFAGVPEIKRPYLYSVIALLRSEEGTMINHVCCLYWEGTPQKISFALQWNSFPEM